MPAAFAHDLFGRLVYRKLDPGIRRAVRREKDCFYLGLFGPGILFFYRSLNDNRIVHKGFWLHEEPARVLFFHGIKAWEKEKDPEKKAAIEAYLLGFACHFALDHSLHEYVNHTDDSTIFTHGEIETELDRRLLVREGMTPLRADVTSHVKNTSMTRLAASRVLSESRETVGECIMSFKAAMRIFVNSGELVKTFICLGLRAAGHYDQVHGMLMRRRPVRGLKTVADYLELEFYKTIPFGVRMVTELYRALEEGTELPREYKGNFEGSVFGKGPVRW